MQVDKFEDLVAWQKSRELIKIVYVVFRANRDYAFRDQIQRAAVSIGNNIAEGFERRSDKQLNYFLFISKGSCGEVRSMLYTALDLEYIDPNTFQDLYDRAIEISRILSGFIKSL